MKLPARQTKQRLLVIGLVPFVEVRGVDRAIELAGVVDGGTEKAGHRVGQRGAFAVDRFVGVVVHGVLLTEWVCPTA